MKYYISCLIKSSFISIQKTPTWKSTSKWKFRLFAFSSQRVSILLKVKRKGFPTKNSLQSTGFRVNRDLVKILFVMGLLCDLAQATELLRLSSLYIRWGMIPISLRELLQGWSEIMSIKQKAQGKIIVCIVIITCYFCY